MNKLHLLIKAFAVRGECTCERCIDSVADAEHKQPEGHTADLVFFKVGAGAGANAQDLLFALQDAGISAALFDGKEHGYMEIGGLVGDQGAALMLMGIGSILGLWDLLTPRKMLGDCLTEEMELGLAGGGYVTIKAKSEVPA